MRDHNPPGWTEDPVEKSLRCAQASTLPPPGHHPVDVKAAKPPDRAAMRPGRATLRLRAVDDAIWRVSVRALERRRGQFWPVFRRTSALSVCFLSGSSRKYTESAERPARAPERSEPKGLKPASLTKPGQAVRGASVTAALEPPEPPSRQSVRASSEPSEPPASSDPDGAVRRRPHPKAGFTLLGCGIVPGYGLGSGSGCRTV